MNEEFETIQLGFGPLLISGTLWSVPAGSPSVSFEVAVGDMVNDFGDRAGSHVVTYYRTERLSVCECPLFEAKWRGPNA